MPMKWIRYGLSLFIIVLMVAVAEYTDEKEIIFPEMVALTIGSWIVNKQVWRIRRRQIILLMTLGAVTGLCIVRYSPLPQLFNLCLAFTFAGACLLISRTTLIPLISACMLPVLLQTESWVYPAAVFLMSVTLVVIQKWMEKQGWRQKIIITAPEKPRKKDINRWGLSLIFVFIVTSLAVWTGFQFLIIPPLIVTFTEMVHSKAGFRNRPVQVLLFLIAAVSLGTLAQFWGYYYLHLPQSIVALFIAICLFGIFELTGKFFAPAGALAFIPMIIPKENLCWLPLQAAAGAVLFIAIAMLFFQQCYKWSRAQLIYCLTPTLLREYLDSRK